MQMFANLYDETFQKETQSQQKTKKMKITIFEEDENKLEENMENERANKAVQFP